MAVALCPLKMRIQGWLWLTAVPWGSHWRESGLGGPSHEAQLCPTPAQRDGVRAPSGVCVPVKRGQEARARGSGRPRSSVSQDGPCAQSCHLTRLPRSFRITDLLVHICPFPGGKTEAMGGPFLPKGGKSSQLLETLDPKIFR